ncbi:MAG TPA: hypothetical protein DIT05_03275 [Morganella sp. (in: Bacteria)]|nr:hypothetical protein [Morganella sp. (in: enterobacteria)]
MSKNGSRYTKENRRKQLILKRKRSHPVRVFIRSRDFLAKSIISIMIFGMIIYSVSKETNNLMLIIYITTSMLLFPFAKKAGDDLIRYYFSEKTFKIINEGRITDHGSIYLFIIMIITIPLAAGYFVYYTIDYYNKFKDNN